MRRKVQRTTIRRLYICTIYDINHCCPFCCAPLGVYDTVRSAASASPKSFSHRIYYLCNFSWERFFLSLSLSTRQPYNPIKCTFIALLCNPVSLSLVREGTVSVSLLIEFFEQQHTHSMKESRKKSVQDLRECGEVNSFSISDMHSPLLSIVLNINFTWQI
jgi:hypothetical protein